MSDPDAAPPPLRLTAVAGWRVAAATTSTRWARCAKATKSLVTDEERVRWPQWHAADAT